MTRSAELLRTLYQGAVDAVQPDAAMRVPLHTLTPAANPSWVIGLGKAATGMATPIVEWLGAHGRRPAGGLIVAPEASAAPDPALDVMVGDHPIPSGGSEHAAEALGELIQRIPAAAEVHVAISGGASALIAGPLPGLSMRDVNAAFELLLTAGLDIHEMNAVRKRLTRWSAGRLALALAGRRLHVWVISDVIGDNLGSIASGPCTGDEWTSAEVRRILVEHDLLGRLPGPVQRAMDQETPKPDDPRLREITPEIIASNRVAMNAVIAAAMQRGIRTRYPGVLLEGEAADMGVRVVAAMTAESAGELLVWGGETTVTVPADGGLGGRSQELALAASRSLHRGIGAGTLLAAGTDGRDGPTDAAGAIVDGSTWGRIIAKGRDPEADLRGHDAYRALDAAGALLRTGSTGTNVMDVAIALIEAPQPAP